jgi:hypothetical protein
MSKATYYSIVNNIFKWTFITFYVGIGLFILYAFIVIMSILGVFDKHYSKEDLIENYNSNTKEIMNLTTYVKSITPANKTVQIEFDGDRTLEIFHVTANGKYNSNWDIKVNSSKTDTLLRQLGWTRETLSTLKEKLDNVNCISVESGEPCTIGYQRSGMGMYLYKVFNQTLNDSLKNKYNDGCTYIYYKDNIVLEYGGGAIGSQCFKD